MENASKALIIAGAILISIVIISLGIAVVNNVRGTAQNSNINSEQAQAFNAKFNLGNHLTGSQVNSIMQTVISENAANRNDTDYTLIVVKYNSATTVPTSGGNYVGTPVQMSSAYSGVSALKNLTDAEKSYYTFMRCTFDTSKYFKVTADDYAANGYIKVINVVDD